MLQRPEFLHDIANLVAMILGEPTVGSHVSVLSDILDTVSKYELSVLVEEAALCTDGLVNGLARSAYSPASVANVFQLCN